MPQPDPKTSFPPWLSQPISMPPWLLLLLLGSGVGGSGLVGAFTRTGDLSQVQSLIDGSLSSARASDSAQQAEILRRLESLDSRLNRIETRVDALADRQRGMP